MNWDMIDYDSAFLKHFPHTEELSDLEDCREILIETLEVFLR